LEEPQIETPPKQLWLLQRSPDFNSGSYRGVLPNVLMEKPFFIQNRFSKTAPASLEERLNGAVPNTP
jgi:hypothetical protein